MCTLQSGCAASASEHIRQIANARSILHCPSRAGAQVNACLGPARAAIVRVRCLSTELLMRLHNLICLILLVGAGTAGAAAAPTPSCGDQGKVPAAERVKNTAHWT